MVKSKWMKIGAATFLSISVLAACGAQGGPEEEDIPEIDADEEVEEAEETEAD